jgi:predicted small secreted protein
VKRLKLKKKNAFAFLFALLCCFVFAACDKAEGEGTDPEATETTVPAYIGILSKLRIGMTESKILSMLADNVPAYYQNDFEMWTVDPDTNMQRIRDYIPADALSYFADDSIITYYFKNQNGNPEKILTGFMEEVYGVFPQDVSIDFYNDTIKRLTEEYGVEPTGTQTGEQGIDEELVLKQVFDCPSATITFICTYKWQTVNEIEDYYGYSFSVKLMGKAIKEEVALDNEFTPAVTVTTNANGETEKAEEETEKKTEEETEPAE